MSLTKRTKDIFNIAVPDNRAFKELVDAIDAGANPQAAAIAAIGATANIGTTNGAGGAGDAALAVDVESRMDAVEAKIDAVIAALKAAGLMAT